MLLYAGVVGVFALADRYSYRRGANDMSPGLEVAALAALVLIAAFIRSIVVAAKRRGLFWWLPLWYLLCFGVLASQLMV